MQKIIIWLFLIIIIINILILNKNEIKAANIFRNLKSYEEGLENIDNKDYNNDATVYGFKGIYKKANSDYSKIDNISLRKGNKTCIDTRMTNSMGYLCLSQEELNLLKSRGGNDK
tara:strand:+ start:2006 stop:2350 length:345 start_codon:yes stop_codon:yes gene_type:complete